jgi:hypothetical protein
MPRRSNTGSRGSDSAVTLFLAEFCRYLIGAGLSYPQFTALARTAYFKAASDSATFRNRRINFSSVAAMTGLTRVQVRELAKQGTHIPPAKRGRIFRIIEGWTTDPRFVKPDFSPRRLSLRAKSTGFADLIRKYGGDIPPKATLREMVRNGYVTVRDQHVQLEPTAHETKGQVRLKHLSVALTELVKGSRPYADSQYPLRAFTREVTYSGTSAKGRILLQRRSAETLRAFMAELQAAGSAASIESPPLRKQTRRVTRTRVVLLSEELDDEDTHARA